MSTANCQLKSMAEASILLAKITYFNRCTMKKLQLALLAGGKSGEREVSLKGAAEVVKALDPRKYEVKRYDPATDLAKLAAEADSLDVAFILLHGPFGEDGKKKGGSGQLLFRILL
jgi:hypothetical protein